MRNLLFAAALAVSAQGAIAADLSGNWSVTFTWDGSSPVNTTMHITQTGPLLGVEAQDSSTGRGVTLASIAVFKFSSGCEPAYVSTNATTLSMSGEMNCTERTRHGTWSALHSKTVAADEVDAAMGADGH